MLQGILGFLLVVFLIVMVFWTVQFVFGPKPNAKKKTTSKSTFDRQPLKPEVVDKKEKMPKPVKVNKVAKSKYYWYNNNEVMQAGKGEKQSSFYHYFDDVNDVIDPLLMEMYDCGIVRTDILERIAKTRIEVAMDALDHSSNAFALDDEFDEDLFDFEDDFEEEVPEELKPKSGVKTTRLDDYEMVIQAALFEQWTQFVDQLEEEVTIEADDATIGRIRKKLLNYGHNDLEVLLLGPQ